MMQRGSVLISGAGVAGLALAYWLQRFDFLPTVLERSPALRAGGYKVDIRGAAVDVVGRMGILPELLQSVTGMQGASFLDRTGRRRATMDADLFGGRTQGDIEILRGDLTRVLYETARDDVEYIFNDSVTSITQGEHGVEVTLMDGQKRTFDIVVGADGLHSNVRRLTFGDEAQFLRHMDHYLAVFTAPNRFQLDRWEYLYPTPGKTINVYSTAGSAEAKVYLMFAAPSLRFDHRDIDQQKKIVKQIFSGAGWDVPFLLSQLEDAPDFYFDAISQVHMDSWSRGRVVLVGDAGYCASPASGQGTSLALVGAYVLAGELAAAGPDFRGAFTNYEDVMRDYVRQNQALAETNLRGMVLKNLAQIWFQIQMIRILPYLPGKDRIIGQVADAIHQAATAIELRDYP
jgi:2-polyprenyl-6-methoxyphenol hydroxylase-like FAD-dependent oxidoreductase